MLEDLIQYFKTRRDQLLKLVLVALSLVLAVIIYQFLFSKDYPKYSVVRTGMKTGQSGVHLSEGQVYAYNGVAFYSTGVDSSTEPNILLSGVRLPKPKQIIWADEQGALVEFQPPFYSTELESKLRDLEVNPYSKGAESLTWYIDFSEGSVSLFSWDSLDPSKIIYSKQDEGFYYIEPSDEEYDAAIGAKMPYYLMFFSISTKESSPVSKRFLEASQMSLANCASSFKTCFIAPNEDGKSILKGFNAEGRIEKLFSAEGKLVPTNDPDYYLTFITEQGNEDVSEEPVEPLKEIALTRVSDGKTELTGLKVLEDEGYATLLPEKDGKRSIYILNNSLTEDKLKNSGKEDEGRPYRYVSGELDVQSLKVKNKQYTAELIGEKGFFNDLVISSRGLSVAGDNSYQVLSTFSGEAVLMVSSGLSQSTIKVPSQEEVKKAVSACVSNYDKVVQYFEENREFKILVDYRSNLSEKTSEFVDCLKSSNPMALYGYFFTLAPYDAERGKLL